MSEDIGEVALFLASDRSRTITGIAIEVEGGTSVALQDWDSYVKQKKNGWLRTGGNFIFCRKYIGNIGVSYASVC